MKAAFYTLGCKVNQNDTAAMQQQFRENGIQVVAPGQAADIFVVNSCTVTAAASAKSLRALRRARAQNPQLVSVLCGCHPQAFPANAQLLQADVICGSSQRGQVLAAVQAFIRSGQRQVNVAAHTKTFEELPTGSIQGRTRANIKVQDGCNRRCAYCIIPAARGPSRSRDEGAILQELALYAARGYKEVVFSGVNLSSYGQGSATSLPALVEKAAATPGIARIRLSSLEPDLLLQEDITRLKKIPAFCPHFHLSLQSGSAGVLQRMRRPYSPALFRQLVAGIRAAFPGAGLTTDVIVGFPGETEEEFSESMNFIQEMCFLKVHVFPFSARQGTPAATLPAQLEKRQILARAAQMGQLAKQVRGEFIAGQQGAQVSVLLESALPGGGFFAYTQNYIPVLVAACGSASGQILAGRLGAMQAGRCSFTPG